MSALQVSEIVSSAVSLDSKRQSLLSLEKSSRYSNDTVLSISVCSALLSFYKTDTPALIALSEFLCTRHRALVPTINSVVHFLIEHYKGSKETDLLLHICRLSENKLTLENEYNTALVELSQLAERKGALSDALGYLERVKTDVLKSSSGPFVARTLVECLRLGLLLRDEEKSGVFLNKLDKMRAKLFGPRKRKGGGDGAEEEALAELEKKCARLEVSFYMLRRDFISTAEKTLALYKARCGGQENKDDHRHDGVLKFIVLCAAGAGNGERKRRVVREVLAEFGGKLLSFGERWGRLLESFGREQLIDARKLEAADCVAELVGARNEFLSGEESFGKEAVRQLEKAVVEFNLLILKRNYSRISIEKIKHVVDLDSSEIEELLVRMILEGKISGRIDQIEGVLELDQKGKDALFEERLRAVSECVAEIREIEGMIDRTYMDQKVAQ